MISLVTSGSAFNGAGINRYHILSSIPNYEKTNYVSFTDFCRNNFISKNIGRTLIKKKYLICQRLFGRLWVCVNLECYQQLLDYLSIESINFDAQN